MEKVTQETTQTVHDLFADLYAAFNRGDIETVLAAMAPDVDWANGMNGGRVHGCVAVREYWTQQWAMIDPHVEPQRVVDDGAGPIVVDVYQVVRDLAGSIIADQTVQHVYEMHDGLVDQMISGIPEHFAIHFTGRAQDGVHAAEYLPPSSA